MDNILLGGSVMMCGKRKCERCGKIIKKMEKDIVFTNIQQDPKVYYFCTKECKYRWIFELLKYGKQKRVVEYFGIM